MKFEIDIELPEDVLLEWEPVAFRRPRNGDWFHVHGDKRPVSVNEGFEPIGPFIILRRRFQWPAWLKCWYLTWDAENYIYLWDKFRPEFNGVCWEALGGALAIGPQRIDLPFPGGDWRTRIEENPNWKGGE